MKFTPAEIEKAKALKAKGLKWTPSVSHYVWDDSGLIDCESPFHDRVFYILDLKHFLRRGKTIENLQKSLCWLPTWFDAREILAASGTSPTAIKDFLQSEDAIGKGTERLCLYEMIEQSLAESQ